MAIRPLVLVVEDDVELNQLERDLLDVHGLDSVAAYTGAQAVELCGNRHADAILLDIMLPEMDGFEALRRLRTADGRRIPVVILSALDSEDCRRRGFEVGADAYFAKPFDPDEVIQALLNLIAVSATGK
jgi:DNA-binding response OmpR family regulator